MSEETIATPWSMTRQRRYDELVAEILGERVASIDRTSHSALAVHFEVMRRIDEECRQLGLKGGDS